MTWLQAPRFTFWDLISIHQGRVTINGKVASIKDGLVGKDDVIQVDGRGVR